jgi:hypothetical protein
VKPEVSAAHSAVEMMLDGIGDVDGGAANGLRGGTERHGWMVLSFYYFSLPYFERFISFNFLKKKATPLNAVIRELHMKKDQEVFLFYSQFLLIFLMFRGVYDYRRATAGFSWGSSPLPM